VNWSHFSSFTICVIAAVRQSFIKANRLSISAVFIGDDSLLGDGVE
jgi:hypothetical protein